MRLTLLFALLLPVVLCGKPKSVPNNNVVEAGGHRGQLVAEHPRLILTPERLSWLKKQAAADTLLQRYVRQTLDKADKMLSPKEKPLKKELTDRNMLSVSREAVERIYYLGFAWRWTGEQCYLDAARANLLNVCSFDDWNPRHFLDVAEMTHAAAIGYDWLYDQLDQKERDKVRRAIETKGLDAGLEVYANPKSGFHMRVNNWNQVCNNGMIIGALAVGDVDPAYLTKIIPVAVETMPKAMEAFDPEGVCVEGPGYWHYAVRYCTYGFASMLSAMNTDFGLSTVCPGFAQTGYFPIVTTGPTNLMLSYSDCAMRSPRKPLPPMMWLAGHFSDPAFSESEHDVLLRYPAQVWHVIYYTPRVEGWAAEATLDKYLESHVAVACMRSSMTPEALFVGMKAGTTEVSHVQLDMGNFEMDALGERWIIDLGADSYSLPGYFDFKDRRWNYYRNVTSSHNLPVFCGKEQALKSYADMKHMDFACAEPFVVIDLDNPYREVASSMQRGIKLVDSRRAMIVQDEFALLRPGAMDWGVMTDSDLQIDGNKATFTAGGKTMVATILYPAEAVFTVKSARQEAPQKTNEGINRLCIEASDISDGRVCVLFAPVWEDGATAYTQVSPIAKW